MAARPAAAVDAGRAAPVLVVAVDVAFLPASRSARCIRWRQGQSRVNAGCFLPLRWRRWRYSEPAVTCQLLVIVSGLGDMRRVMLDLILLIIALAVAGQVMLSSPRTCCPASSRHSALGRAPDHGAAGAAGDRRPANVCRWPTGLLWLAFAGSQAVRMWLVRGRIAAIPASAGCCMSAMHGWCWGAVLSGIPNSTCSAPASALHACAHRDAVGVFTMRMMARVARAIAGDSIDVTRVMTAAFVMMNLAALIVFGGCLGQRHLRVGRSVGTAVDRQFALFVCNTRRSCCDRGSTARSPDNRDTRRVTGHGVEQDLIDADRASKNGRR